MSRGTAKYLSREWHVDLFHQVFLVSTLLLCLRKDFWTFLQRRLDSSWPCTQQIIPLRAFCVFVQVRGVCDNQFPVYISVLSESETAYGEKSYVQKSDWLCTWSPVLLVLLVFSKQLPSKMMSELLMRHRTICVSLMLDDSVQYNLRNNSRATCGSVVSRLFHKYCIRA